MRIFLVLILQVCLLGVVLGRSNRSYVMDERWVCPVKRDCVKCLRLPQCSWCDSEKKCFSKIIPGFEEYCKDTAIHHVDYGMSLEDNAKCACPPQEGEEKLKPNCLPPGEEGAECSGRGKCECGRCVCDPTPDPENPTQTIMGEYCEYDNFSCDGPRCNEGPYNMHHLDYEDPSMI